MLKKFTTVAGLLAIMVASSSAANAGKDDWARLVESDRDRIDSVEVKRRIGRFKEFQVLSVDGDAYVRNVTLEFRDGKTRTYKIDRFLKNRKPTESIRLPSNDAVIVRFDVEYGESRRGPNTGVVILNGLIGPEPGGWDVLETAKIDGSDREILLRVGRDEDRVGAVRLRGWAEPLRVRKAEIVFLNGKRQSVRIRERLEPGEATDPIDLKGYNRGIRGVSLRLGRFERGASIARIDLLGKRGKRRGKKNRR